MENILKKFDIIFVITGHVIEGHLPNITFEGLKLIINHLLYNTVLLYYILPTVIIKQINIKKESDRLRHNEALLFFFPRKLHRKS